MLEKTLQNYLIINGAKNLRKIDSKLIFLDSEYSFQGGRIDILAMRKSLPVAVELKANNYSSSAVAGQLINYYNFLDNKNGLVYFVAPKVKPGIFSTMDIYKKRVRFFEFDKNLNFYEVFKSDNKKKFFYFSIPKPSVDLSYKYLKAPLVNLLSKGIDSLLKL